VTVKSSFTPDYFERLYSKDADPWMFATSRYERDKYQETISVLGGRRFANAFEVGCSIGILTRMLAHYCDSLIATDVSEIALSRARCNCGAMNNVTFERMYVPHEWPEKTFDLIVLSEVLYFLSRADMEIVASKSISSLHPNGSIVLVNWTEATDYPCGGDEAAQIFLAHSSTAFKPSLQRRREHYRIDVLAAW
jgi:2-polyprenyl-3-methyl-5-hydroxy-6-metoxy-1,4-benzoquinol methylase